MSLGTDATDAVAADAATASANRGAAEHLRPIARSLGPALLIVLAQVILFPAPGAIMLRGLIIGGLTALVALGMALIYRANRIVNFAQADLGFAPTVVAYLLLTESGVPYPVAVVVGLLLAIATGALTERLVIRRFADSPRLLVTIATIGLSQLLAALALLAPRLWDVRLIAGRVEPPFDLTRRIGSLTFDANDLLALLATPIAVALVGAFLRGSDTGVAIRAAADSAARASLLGVPVARLQTLVWSLSAALAFVAVFLRSGILELPSGTALGFSILFRALAALLLGRMTDLVGVTSAAMALGILELGVEWNHGFELIDPVLGVVIVVALVVRRRDAAGMARADISAWHAGESVRPVPAALAALPVVKAARWGAFALIAVVAVVLPHLLPADDVFRASAVLIYAILGVSLVVLSGWAGTVSLGQVAFFAIGAAVAGAAIVSWDVDLFPALVLASAVGAVAAVIVGIPTLRMRGLSLAVTTFALALATTSYLLNNDYFSWVPSDERVVRPAFLGGIEASSEVQVYYLALIVLALALLGMRGVRSGRFGRALVALRDNERAAQAYAVDAARTQLAAFALSGAIAALAGGLFVHHEQAFDGTSYSPIENLAVFTMVVVGGMGSLAGAVLGALFLLGGRWFLDTNWQFVVSGLGVLAILLVAPSGLAGLVYRARDAWLRTVARSRDLDVPGYSSSTTGPDTAPTAPSAADAGRRGADAVAAPSPFVGGADDHTRAGGNGDGPPDAPTTGVESSADPTSPAATPPAVAQPFDVGAGDRGVAPAETTSPTAEPPAAIEPLGAGAGAGGVGPPDSASRAAGSSAGVEALGSGAGAGGVAPSDSSPTAESPAAREPLGAGAGAGEVGPAGPVTPAAESSSGGVQPLGAGAGSTSEGSADSESAAAQASATETAASGAADGVGEWLLDVQRVEAGYSGVPVLFGVDLAVRAGEAVALLGTNGAGKSTLLNAISGLTPPTAGRVLVGGDDLTGRPAHLVAAQGVAQMPGGKGTFPTLTVAENLRVAGWLRRGDRSGLAADLERLQALFPVLRERSGQLAGSLSGGQQQMLALAMSVLTRPRLLMIDELSLGLAPVVVADLLRFVAELRADGTTLVIVEQSVNVALEVADRAVFLERGEVRFTGPASDLLDRPDLLRSVFLGAVTPAGAPSTAIPSTPTPGRPSEAPAVPDAAADVNSSPGPQPTTGAPAHDLSGAEPAASAAPAPAAGPGGGATVAAPTGPVLEVHGVSVAFGGVHAVEDVSFDVAPGEVVGVIGPNGAGKTTLFDLLSGFVPPSTGRVVLAGRDVTGLNASDRARKGLGRSFQDARLFASMTVEESIAVALERWTRAGDPLSAAFHLPNAVDDEHRVRRRVDQLIGLLGLEGFRSLFVGELSTGTRRVVDLACLLAHRPRVVLLDEPASGIAQREVEQLAPLIRRIRDETGASLVVVEHDIPLVEQVADRVVAMDQGRVVAVGPPAVVLSDPAVLRSYVGDDHAAIRRSGTRATARPHAETRG